MPRGIVNILSAVDGMKPKEWLEKLWVKTGKDILELARQLDVLPQTALNALRHHKIPYESKGVYNRPERDWVRRRAFLEATGYPSTKAAIEEVIRRELTAYAAGKFLGVDRKSVIRWAAENGLELKPPPGKRRGCYQTNLNYLRVAHRAKLSRQVVMPEGGTRTLDDLAKEMGITRCAMRYRIEKWGVAKAISTPVRRSSGRRPDYPSE